MTTETLDPHDAIAARRRWVEGVLGFRRSVLEAMAAGTSDADGPVERCRAWLAVERQAHRYTRAWPAGRLAVALGLDAAAADCAAAATALEELARSEHGRFPDEVRHEAAATLGLRLAIVGKGGVGKTMIAATLSRLLARRGRAVLAADLDTNPGLALSLGMGATEAGLPPDALQEEPGAPYGWGLRSGLLPPEAVERYSQWGPDGVRYLGIGKIAAVDKTAARRSVNGVLQLLSAFGDPGWDVVGDLEAGLTTPFEAYHGFADLVVVVVGPAWRSALTARRLLPIVAGVPCVVVANRWGEQPDHDGLDPLVRVPADTEVADAERLGIAPLDRCPHSPAIAAVGTLADALTNQEVVR